MSERYHGKNRPVWATILDLCEVWHQPPSVVEHEKAIWLGRRQLLQEIRHPESVSDVSEIDDG